MLRHGVEISWFWGKEKYGAQVGGITDVTSQVMDLILHLLLGMYTYVNAFIGVVLITTKKVDIFNYLPMRTQITLNSNVPKN